MVGLQPAGSADFHYTGHLDLEPVLKIAETLAVRRVAWTPGFPTFCHKGLRGYKLIVAIETGTNGLKLWLPGLFLTGRGMRE
jgi:hypothetical protein